MAIDFARHVPADKAELRSMRVLSSVWSQSLPRTGGGHGFALNPAFVGLTNSSRSNVTRPEF